MFSLEMSILVYCSTQAMGILGIHVFGYACALGCMGHGIMAQWVKPKPPYMCSMGLKSF